MAHLVSYSFSKINCHGLALDDRRFLYVTEISHNRVKRWRLEENSNQEDKVVAGGHREGGLINQLNGPTFLFVDDQYSVFVSDSNNHRVMKWVEGAREGVVVAGGGGIGKDLTKLSHPQGVIVDHLETVFVVDPGNYRVMRWPKGARQGDVILGGDTTPSQRTSYGALCFDRYGNLYTGEVNRHRVQKFEINSSEP